MFLSGTFTVTTPLPQQDLSNNVDYSSSNDSSASLLFSDSQQQNNNNSSGSKIIDIVKSYKWNATNVSQRDDIPYILLEERRFNLSQVALYINNFWKTRSHFFRSLFNRELNSWIEVYEAILPSEPTGNIYKFPFLNQTFVNRSTQWTTSLNVADVLKQQASNFTSLTPSILASLPNRFRQSISQFLNKKATKLATGGLLLGGGIAASPELSKTLSFITMPGGIAVENETLPLIFQDHNRQTITVEFVLFNILDEKDWIQNRNFIERFVEANTYKRIHFNIGESPVFYRVLVPGLYYSFASYISELNISNVGNILFETDAQPKQTVPEAYKISFSLTEMFMQSKNFWKQKNQALP